MSVVKKAGVVSTDGLKPAIGIVKIPPKNIGELRLRLIFICEVSGDGDARKRKNPVLLPSPLPFSFVDLHSRVQVSYVCISGYFISIKWPFVFVCLFV